MSHRMCHRSVMEKDGFTLVPRRSRGGRGRRGDGRVSCRSLQDERVKDVDEDEHEVQPLHIETLANRIRSLSSTTFSNSMVDFVNTLLSVSTYRHVVCLGLGPFSSCPLARSQLAFLLNLVSANDNGFKTNDNDFRVEVCDPIFSSLELRVLESLGFASSHLKRDLEVKSSTLFFLPHCPLDLINSVLKANMSRLVHVVLLCNSFSSMQLRFTDVSLLKEADCVAEVLNGHLVNEVAIDEHLDPAYKNVFNDLAIHTFNQQESSSEPIFTSPIGFRSSDTTTRRKSCDCETPIGP